MRSIDFNRVSILQYGGAEAFQQTQDTADILKIRDIAKRTATIRKQGRSQDGQRGVFGTAYGDCAVQAFATLNDDFIHDG